MENRKKRLRAFDQSRPNLVIQNGIGKVRNRRVNSIISSIEQTGEIRAGYYSRIKPFSHLHLRQKVGLFEPKMLP
jgi:hypothetical protein